ncbi:MAG: FAD-dependent oxidoreductase [Planctomycetota bacterium]|jgi:hypothetical protein|nr:FAD-dependent oxidoreductase [Planctomycetota bacterium]
MRAQLAHRPPTDVLICGMSLIGCEAALRARAAGARVMLTEAGSTPLPSWTSCLRPWITCRERDALPKHWRAVFAEASHRSLDADTDMLHLGILSRATEDLLLDAGVELAYLSQPAAAALDAKGHVTGIALGGKYGLVVQNAGRIIDCTTLAAAARAAGARAHAVTTPQRARWSLELATPHTGPSTSLAVEGGEAHWRDRYCELDLSIEAPTGPWGYPDLIAELRRRARLIIQQLRERQPELPIAVAHEAERILLTAHEHVDANSTAIAVLGPHDGREHVTEHQLHQFPAQRLAAYDAPITACTSSWSPDTPVSVALRSACSAQRAAQTVSYHDPQFDDNGPVMTLDMAPVAIADEAAVVVAGAGTSGLPATIACAKAGLDVVCLEGRSAPGGTHTVGGVPFFWYGRWTPGISSFHDQLRRRCEAEHIPQQMAMDVALEETGSRIRYAVTSVGVERSGTRISTLHVVTPWGLCAVRAQHWLDASGDADLAALAGAAYTYGREHDELTLWYSHATVRHGEVEGSRHFLSLIDMRSLNDTTRGIVTARRQDGCFGAGDRPGFLVTPRESRHISGRARLTYQDVIMNRYWKDAVAGFQSNVDLKGLAASRMILCGLHEPDYLRTYTCMAPYGAFVPRDLDNILVLGKAYDACHDALSMARMQADLASVGLMAGHACACAATNSCDLAAVPVSKLQNDLVAAGLIYASDLLPGGSNRVTPSEHELPMIAERLATGPMELADQAALLSAGTPARRALEAVYRGSVKYTGQRIAVLLSLLGSDKGADQLLELLDTALASPDLPVAEWTPHDLPDHGRAPEPVRWIHCLAAIPDRRLIPRLHLLVDRLELDKPVCDSRWCYIHALAEAARVLGEPEIAPALHQVLSAPAFAQVAPVPAHADPRVGISVPLERYLYLQLCLGRALCACDDPAGASILEALAGDQRTALARSARKALAATADPLEV